MWKKFKRWLCERFLPAYCREAYKEEVSALEKQIEQYREENARLRSYIDGLETAMRRQSRIVIYAREVSKS